MQKYLTEQETFWAGTFGDEYTTRNTDIAIEAGNVFLFSKILSHVEKVSSVIEYGANIGLNLKAIKQLLPFVQCSAVEINERAVKQLRMLENAQVHHQSILNFTPSVGYDFVLVKGVLIHIDPTQLPVVYDLLYNSSNRYICLAEYYNPKPVEVSYRGFRDRLFKRDFAGEMLDRFPSLRLVSYGFAYHRDSCLKQDDISWFLLEK